MDLKAQESKLSSPSGAAAKETMAWASPLRKTTQTAMTEVKEVIDGAVGVRLIDQVSFYPIVVDPIEQMITDTPSAVITDVLKFDSSAPGPNAKVSAQCPICSSKITINQFKPHPSK